MAVSLSEEGFGEVNGGGGAALREGVEEDVGEVVAARLELVATQNGLRPKRVLRISGDATGEAVTAVIEVKPGFSVVTDEIIAMCKERLGSIKAPKNVFVWPQLPRSNVGKVLKKDIRAHYWKDAQRAI